MKQITKLITLATLFVAAHALYGRTSATVGADIPELMQFLEDRKYNFEVVNIALENKKLQGLVLTNVDLPYILDFSGSDLTNAVLSNSNLRNIDLKNTNLTNVNFANTNLTSVNFSGSDLTKANFTNANLTAAKFDKCKGFNSIAIDKQTNFQGATGLTTQQKVYARSKGAQNVPK